MADEKDCSHKIYHVIQESETLHWWLAAAVRCIHYGTHKKLQILVLCELSNSACIASSSLRWSRPMSYRPDRCQSKLGFATDWLIVFNIKLSKFSKPFIKSDKAQKQNDLHGHVCCFLLDSFEKFGRSPMTPRKVKSICDSEVQWDNYQHKPTAMNQMQCKYDSYISMKNWHFFGSASIFCHLPSHTFVSKQVPYIIKSQLEANI